jgi:ABC-2 type transport system permease protein
MRMTWIVAKREMKALLTSRRTLFSVLVFIIAWGFISVPRLLTRLGGDGGFENTIFYLSTLLCVYAGFVFSSHAFLGEKRDSRIGTLLCSPLTVKKFWAGKVIGVVVPSFVIGIVVAAAAGLVFSFRAGTISAPSLPLAVYIFIVLPLFVALFTGFLGFLQLVLGMRESRILNIVVMVILFGGLGLANTLAGTTGFVRWPVIGTLFGVVVLFLTLLSYGTKFIKVERIITSLE